MDRPRGSVPLNADTVLNSLFPKDGSEVKLVPERINELAEEVMQAEARSAPYHSALIGVAVFTTCTWVVAPVAWIDGLLSPTTSAKWMGGTVLFTFAASGVVYWKTKDDARIEFARTLKAWRALCGAIKGIGKGQEFQTKVENHLGFSIMTERDQPQLRQKLEQIAKKWNHLFPNEQKEWSSVAGVFMSAAAN